MRKTAVVLAIATSVSFAPLMLQAQEFNYWEALQKSLYYFEAQRSGDLPDERGKKPGQNRVEWRGDSHLDDGSRFGIDLSGGWYDAGDSPKWNATMCAGALGLYWSGLRYRDAYIKTGQMPYLKDNLRWVCDYFIKCMTYSDINDISTYRIYVQIDVGKGVSEGPMAYEIMDLWTEAPERKIWYADRDAPNSQVVASMASTLAATSTIFRRNSEGPADVAYADTLLKYAENLYEFADTYRDVTFKDQDGTIIEWDGGWGGNIWYFFYNLAFWDEFCWAALILDEANKEKDAGFGDEYLDSALVFSEKDWFKTSKREGFLAYIVLAEKYPENSRYKNWVEEQLDDLIAKGTSPGGLGKIQNEWGTLRHVNAAACQMFAYSDIVQDSAKKEKYYTWAKSQLDYALGSNPDNRSYVIGFVPPGKDSVTRYHSSTAHGGYAGWEHFIKVRPEYNPTNRHVMYGHLCGGPDWNDDYQNEAFAARNMPNFAQTECALDYMYGFVPNLARMAREHDGSIDPDFPPAEVRAPSPSVIDDQYFVIAKLSQSASNSVDVEAWLNNRSNLPARGSDKLSFRYYFTLDGGDPSDITATINGANEGASISEPIHVTENLYYIVLNFSGTMIMPLAYSSSAGGFVRLYHKHVNFRIESSGTWDASNDWSFDGLDGDLAERMKMPIFDNGKYLFGLVPPEGAVYTRPLVSEKASSIPNVATGDFTYYTLQGKRIKAPGKTVGRYGVPGKGVYIISGQDAKKQMVKKTILD